MFGLIFEVPLLRPERLTGAGTGVISPGEVHPSHGVDFRFKRGEASGQCLGLGVSEGRHSSKLSG